MSDDVNFWQLPSPAKTAIVSFLDLDDRLNLAAASQEFHDAVFCGAFGCQLRILTTNLGKSDGEVEPQTRLAFDSSVRRGDPLEIDSPICFWSSILEAGVPNSRIREELPGIVSHLFLAVDDKKKEIQTSSLPFRWILALRDSRLEAIALRPCNLAKSTFFQSQKDFFQSLCDLIISQSRNLKELHFHTWPLDPSSGIPPVHQLVQSLPILLQQLRRFSYFWGGNDVRDWQPTSFQLPEKEINVSFLSSLENLQELNLDSQILCQELLVSFSKTPTSSLRRLRVCFAHDSPTIIGEDVWRRFAETNRNCGVEFTLMKHHFRAGNAAWKKAFVAGVPLTRLVFMKHSECEDRELNLVVENYGSTLESLSVKSFNSTVSPETLVAFPEKCRRLRSLVFMGVVVAETVVKVARCRGRSWRFLGFVDQQINLADPKAEDQDEFFFERRKMIMEAESRQESLLQDLTRCVSSIVERDWTLIPLTRAAWNVERLNAESDS